MINFFLSCSCCCCECLLAFFLLPFENIYHLILWKFICVGCINLNIYKNGIDQYLLCPIGGHTISKVRRVYYYRKSSSKFSVCFCWYFFNLFSSLNSLFAIPRPRQRRHFQKIARTETRTIIPANEQICIVLNLSIQANCALIRCNAISGIFRTNRICYSEH